MSSWKRRFLVSSPLDETLEPWVDPIVAEVRAARGRVLAAAGGDLHALCELLRAREREAGRTPLDHPPRRAKLDAGQAA